MGIEEQDLMWHLEATERELSTYYNAATNARHRITCIQHRVSLMLEELEQLRKTQ